MALRSFLGTCVDNITVLNYTVKVTLDVSMLISGVVSLLEKSDEKTIDAKMGYEVIMKNMLSLRRFIEALMKPH